MHRLQRFLRSPSCRLALTYLVIIMVLSIGFSVIFYKTSTHELGRQLPPNSFFHNAYDGVTQPPPPRVDTFIKLRINEGREELFHRLMLVNAIALISGTIVSYFLARQSLRPIEAAMVAQAQFVSDASHELRTPLTAIQSSNEVNLRNPKLSLAEAKAVIRSNTADVVNMKTLTDALLTMAQQDNRPLVRSAVSLPTVITSAINQVIPLAQAKRIGIEDHTPTLTVLASDAMLTQVVVSLLDNAIKYSPAGTGKIQLTAYKKGHFGYIDVTDNGIGIKDENIGHIFDRFYRVDSARTGSSGYGLGLAIAHNLITQQQGSVRVVSEYGNGSTFTIRLPLA
jgi:two-component system sensor histidine kinase CiaH